MDERRVVRVVCAVIEHGGRILAARRAPGRSLAGKWEFPGGKVESGEDAVAALRREIAEELGVEIDVGSHVGAFVHAYPSVTIELSAWRAVWRGGEFCPTDHDDLAWLPCEGLSGLDWAEADLPVVAALVRPSAATPGAVSGGSRTAGR